ncbi:thioesterase family protein [Nocardioides sp.]|uniref:thioesterase family protein n=1 Tax=Nocardioides sp. TaxID=35761 RepID=UPI002639D6B4|nr:thioesterase family protein [Nocardioides sp.]
MAQYDDDIAVQALGEGRFSADLLGEWTVGGGLNGGYLLGVIGNAIRQVVPAKPDPITVSAFYLGPGRPGPAEVVTEIKRDGGSLAVVAADLEQEGSKRISVLATYADRASISGEVHTTAVEPELPPVEACVSTDAMGPAMLEIAPMYRKFEMRFPASRVGWAQGAPSGEGIIEAWFRFRDDRPADAFSLVTIADLLPPVAFDLGLPGWSPTLELTVHVRGVPAPGWLKVRHATRNLADGMFEEDCEIWDSAGRLVAQSRQLARTPRA